MDVVEEIILGLEDCGLLPFEITRSQTIHRKTFAMFDCNQVYTDN